MERHKHYTEHCGLKQDKESQMNKQNADKMRKPLFGYPYFVINNHNFFDMIDVTSRLNIKHNQLNNSFKFITNYVRNKPRSFNFNYYKEELIYALKKNHKELFKNNLFKTIFINYKYSSAPKDMSTIECLSFYKINTDKTCINNFWI